MKRLQTAAACVVAVVCSAPALAATAADFGHIHEVTLTGLAPAATPGPEREHVFNARGALVPFRRIVCASG